MFEESCILITLRMHTHPNNESLHFPFKDKTFDIFLFKDFLIYYCIMFHVPCSMFSIVWCLEILSVSLLLSSYPTSTSITNCRWNGYWIFIMSSNLWGMVYCNTKGRYCVICIITKFICFKRFEQNRRVKYWLRFWYLEWFQQIPTFFLDIFPMFISIRLNYIMHWCQLTSQYDRLYTVYEFRFNEKFRYFDIICS